MSKRRSILLLLTILIALFASGCGAISGYFATETPTPTNTPLPTSTPTPRPTATRAPIGEDAVEEICPLSPFFSLPEEIQASETVLYVDEEAGYELAFSDTWLLIDLVEGDMDQILADMTEELPEVQGAIEQFLKQSGETDLRLLSLYGNLEFVFGGIFPHMYVSYLANPVTTNLPIEMLAEQTKLVILASIPEIEILATGLAENGQAVQIGLICSRLDLSVSGRPTLQKIVVVKAPAGLLVITFIAAEEVFAEIEPLFDAVIHSFQVLEPESE